ncbi:MAG: hypothetical protein ACLVJ3_13690 [Coprococcus phoceensis]
MKSHTSLVAQQTRLSEWADLIRDCQNRPQGMKIDEWCQLHDITKASYYWRLRKVREAYLETADHTQTFVEVPSSAIHPVNMASEYKISRRDQKRKQSHFGNHRAGICFISANTFGSDSQCSMMVPDLKKCIWHVDLQICAEGLTA